MSEERKHLFRLPIARIIKEKYEQKSLEIRDIALHLDSTIRKIKLIEIQENFKDVYSKEQAQSLVDFLCIGPNEAVLSKEDAEKYKSLLSTWRKHINEGKLGSAVKLLENHSLDEITYLPFEHNLIMLYKLFDIKFIMAQRNFDLADKLLGAVEVRRLSPENRYHYYYNMGSLHIHKKRYDLALRYYTKANETGFEDEQEYQQSLHFNLGLCYSKIGSYLRAILSFEKTDNLIKREGASFFPMYLDNSLGMNYIRIGELHLAKKRLSSCMRYAEALENKKYMGASLHNLGWLCLKEKNYDRAKDYFKRADAFFERGEDAFFENLYYSIICLIKTEDFFTRVEIAFAERVAKEYNNKDYEVLYKTLPHLVTLQKEEKESSLKYIKDKTIPALIRNFEYDKAAEYYEALENHFIKNGKALDALEIKASSYELYKKMTQGGRAYEKKIDWPVPTFNTSS